ncbi:MAG: hypothetical protein AAF745_15500, partial [Planctomycetota bacterium]
FFVQNLPDFHRIHALAQALIRPAWITSVGPKHELAFLSLYIELIGTAGWMNTLAIQPIGSAMLTLIECIKR